MCGVILCFAIYSHLVGNELGNPRWILDNGDWTFKIKIRRQILDIGHSKSILFMELTWLSLKNIFSHFQKKITILFRPHSLSNYCH